MRKLWLGILGLAAASTTQAAVVTFTLSVDDDGFGNGGAASTPGSFAVYADVSTGDNFGLFAFGADLKDGAIDFIANLSPQGQFRKTGSPTKFVGFSAGVTEDAAGGKISGLPDLAKGTNLIPAYGFGQTGGDLNALKPTGYGNYVDSNPNAPGSAYNGHFLLGIGQYHGPISGMGWDSASVDNKASVYTSSGGSTASAIAQLVLKVVTPGPTGRNFVGLANTPDSGANTQPNVAVGGAIAVTGANGSYVSEVDQLTADNITGGNAPIQTIGNEPGNVYVMAKLNGDISGFLADPAVAPFVAGAADSQSALLHAAYDSQFGPGGFNALFRFPNIQGAKVFSIETTGSTGVSVDQLAAVPEPATMSLLGLGALGLLARRRRNA